jgi:hypothetical protein
VTARQYQEIIDRYLKDNNIKVAGYYRTIWGNSWIKTREIKIPKPVNQCSFYICLHEIGHILAPIDYNAPIWLHEYHATKFALDESRKLGIEYGKEVMEAIRGYLKYILKKSVRKKHVIDTIPSKVFKLAGVNKSYWKSQINKNKKAVVPFSVHDFMHWRNIKVCWKPN